jgi:hypothetical protein
MFDTWTDADRDKAISKGKAGGKLSSWEQEKLKEAVRVDNRGADAADALKKQGRR